MEADPFLFPPPDDPLIHYIVRVQNSVFWGKNQIKKAPVGAIV